MLSTFRQRLAGVVALAFDGVLFVASLAGASISLFLGKLFACVLFVLLAVGVLNRFVRRRHGDMNEGQRSPIWVSLVCVGLSVVETGAIVEAMNMPVRFDQVGFEKSNLLLVVALLFVLFYGQRYVFLRLLNRRRTAGAL
jgi:flagellar biogenesis protein FliO